SASWWAPFLLIVIFSYAFMFTMGRQVGFEQSSKNEINRSPKRVDQFEKSPTDQQAQQITISAAINKCVAYCHPLFILVFFLITTRVMMGVLNMGFSTQLPFKVFWAIIVFSALPGIVHATLGMVSLFAGVDPQGFNINNPVATTPAYFMDSSNKFLYGMASGLD